MRALSLEGEEGASACVRRFDVAGGDEVDEKEEDDLFNGVEAELRLELFVFTRLGGREGGLEREPV